MYINAQSLLSHKYEIEQLLYKSKFDILCVSETWLYPFMSSSFVNIPNYNLYREDCGRGGGVCLFVRDYLKVTELTNGTEKQEGIEMKWLSIQHRKLPSIILGCVYRHPKAPAASFNYISESFKNMILRNKPIFIFGDFNDDLLKNDNKMNKLVSSLKLHQLINIPTRITPNSKSLIDLFITNKKEMVIHSDVIPSIVADHEAITVSVNLRKPKRLPIFKTFRCLKNYSQEKICSLLMNEVNTLNGILNTDNAHNQTEILTSVLNKCVDSCAPLVTREIIRPPAPWISDDIKQNIKTRDYLQMEIKKDRNNVILREQHKEQKKKVKSLMETGRKQHNKEELKKNKNDFSTSWKIVKGLLHNNCAKESHTEDHDLTNKAEKFNEFFANIGRKTFEKTQEEISRNNVDARIESQNVSVDNQQNRFKPSPVDCETVILTVKNLKGSSAYGSDGISLRFIKDSLYMIAFYVTIIINTSIVTNTYPALWKLSHVVPIFKSGDRDEVSNFRPISLLPVLSKILEKIIANQLSRYLEINHLISDSQHGFRPKLSTETALLKISDKIYDNIDKKKISLLILLDLSKAFDSVNHNILINKCQMLNIDPSWLNDYLRNRSQCVRIKNTISSPKDITFGVPQGSILGPILFNIYVNDLKKFLTNCFIIQYADDTQILLEGKVESIKELIKKAEETLNKVKFYFQTNGLLLNESKTQCIFIGSRQYISEINDNIQIDFNGNSIRPMKSVKNLGVHFDRYMSFESHIDELYKKVMGTLIYLNRVKDFFEPDTRLIVVQSLALSLINYCFVIWGSTNDLLLNRVQKLQNFAARVAIGTVKKFEHITPFLLQLEWLKVKDRYIYDVNVIVFKIVRNMFPNWLYDFNTVDSVTGMITRQANNLVIRRAFTNVGSREMRTRGPHLWNRLPSVIREAASLNSFKNKLQKYILNKNL